MGWLKVRLPLTGLISVPVYSTTGVFRTCASASLFSIFTVELPLRISMPPPSRAVRVRAPVPLSNISW